MSVSKVDTSMSESGDYGEPSSTTVVLPDPPAWLNVDGLMSYDDRQRLKDLIEEGRDLLPDIASWAERARYMIGSWDAELPGVVWESAEMQKTLGIQALNDVMLVIGMVGGNPAGEPTFEKLKELREVYPQYGESRQ